MQSIATPSASNVFTFFPLTAAGLRTGSIHFSKMLFRFLIVVCGLSSAMLANAQCPTVQGTITSSSNSQLCSGQTSSININVTPTNGGTYSGVFTKGRTFSNLTPAAGIISPTYTFTNNTFAPITETFQLQSLTYTYTDPSTNTTYNCPANQLNGSTNITVFPVSDLDAILNNPSSNLCNNTTVSINVTQPSGYGGTYNRTTQYNGAGHTAPTNAANQPYGTFTDVLTNNTSSSPIMVRYIFTPISPNALQCVGRPDTIDVMVNPNPKVTCPGNVTQSTDPGVCTAVVNNINPVSSSPNDCNGSAPVITYAATGQTTFTGTGSASGKTFNKGITTVTYTITDAKGNTGTCSFTVTINDTQAPVFTNMLQADITENSNGGADMVSGDCRAQINYTTYTANDNCGGMVTITYSQASGTYFPVGTTQVIVTATDNAMPANVARDTFLVTVVDTENPSIMCPGNITTNNDPAPNECGASVTFSATATDNCSAMVTYTIPGSPNPVVITSPYTFPVGTTTVTAKATDPAGNTATCTFTVTVNNVTGNYYVNDGSTTGDSYTQGIGNDMTGNGTRCKPYATINKAISVASTGNTIYVDAGSYAENVVVNKSLTILGHNSNINPNTGSRVAESIVMPGTTATSTESSTSGTIFRLGSGSGHLDVTIKGFTIDGTNAALTGGRTLNGVAVKTGAGITNSINSFDANPNAYDVKMIVQNNIIQNLERYGVLADNVPARTPVTGTDVSFNKIDNLPSGDNFGGGRGRGITFEENHYGTASGNVMTRVNVGWQNDNYNQPSPGAGTVISNNNIKSYRRGIFHNLQFQGATAASITNNTLAVETNGSFAASSSNFGVEIASIQDAVGVTVSGNNVTGQTFGLLLWNCPTTSTVTVSGGTLTNNANAIYATNVDPQFGDAASSSYVIDGVTITGGTNGIYVNDSSSNSNSATVAIQIQNSTSVSNTANGLVLSGGSASASFSGATPASFASSNTKYIVLKSNGTDVPAGNINATTVSFGGTTGSAATNAQNFAIEDKIDHKIDLATLGFVLVKTNNTFVTVNSFVAPNTAPAIQRGVDAASAAFTVNVGPGTFVEDVNVNKQVTLLGSGYTNTTVSGAIGGNGATIQITAAGVIVDGFKITREGNNPTDWNNTGLNSAGLSINGQAYTVEIRNNWFFGNRTGIDINNSNGNNIHNNLIESNRTGLIFRNQTDNTNMQQNFIRDNFTVGIVFLDGSGGTNSPVQTAANSTFNYNFISGNWYGDVVDRQTGGSIPAPGINIKNFECNWYGQASQPTVTTANSTEPGYAAQIPVIFGGTATAPASPQPDIAGPASANIDYNPWLVNGTDNDPATLGFQPVPNTCTGTPIVIASAVAAPETCGGNNGSITVTFSGGTGPYNIAYTRTTPASPAVGGTMSNITSPYTITNLPAGTYSITISDANSSTANASATITYNPVRNVTQMMTYTTIQGAVTAANPNDSITVCSGTYDEQVVVNKALKIQGLGPVKPIINYTGVAANAARPTIFDVTAASVTIRGFDLRVNLTRLGSAIIASAANVNNLTVQNDTISPYQSTIGTSGPAYGLRNAVSINYGGAPLRVNGSNPINILATGNSITIGDNGTPGNTADDLGFRSGFAVDEGSGTFDNNTIQTINQDIQTRFTSAGDVIITNNTIKGGGVEIAENNAGAGNFTISGNTFDGTFGRLFSSSLRLKNNVNNKTTTVSNNTFTGHDWAISLENYRAVTVNNNVFTPAASSTTYRHITVNTKELSSSSGFFTPNINGVFTNNTFNGSGAAGGLGIAFFNQDNDSPVVGPFTIGTAGNENNFNAGIGTFIHLDNTSGTTAPMATPTVPFSYNLDATNNRFDVGAGLQSPTAMSLSNLFLLEDKVQHKVDTTSLGFVLVKANNTYITTNSFVAPSTAALVQRAIEAASTGFTVNVANGVYNGDVNVNKTVTVRGQSQAAVLRGLYAGNSKSVIVSANNVTVKNVTITRDYGNTFSQWAASTKTEGIIAENVSNFTLDSALVTGNRNGVYIHSVPGFVVKNSNVRDNRTGFQVWGNLDNGQVINNFIHRNFTHGFLINFDQGFTTANNLLVNNNNISGNWYSQIDLQNSNAPGTNVGSFAGSNFNCNWYGTLFPDYAAVNASGMSYTTQVPSQFGGMDPNVNADIRGQEAALITYKPYLNSGVDSDSDSLSGFQPAGMCVQPGSKLYVNDAYTPGSDVYTTAAGNDNNLGTPASPFATVTRALSGASAGDTIYVDAGTHAENVVVNKSVTILGTNYNISPNGGSRLAESVIVPATSNVTTGIVFNVQANDVFVKGFTVDGNNTSLPANGYGFGGASQHARDGFAIRQNNINRLTVSNNIIKNLSYAAVDLFGVDGNTPATTGHTITQNRMEDLGTYDATSGIANWGIGVLLYNNHYADVENNTMSNVRNGIQTGNFVQLNPGAAQFQTLSNNTINPRRRGVFHNEIYQNSSAFTIAGNTITAVSSPNDVLWQGIFISSHFSAPSSTVQGNVVNGSALAPAVESYGMEVWNVDPSNPTLISGGSVTGVNRGIYITNYDNQFGDGPLTVGAKASLSSITFSSCVTGITISDNPASTAHMPVSLTVGTGVMVSNSTDGLVMQGNQATVGSLSNLAFSNIGNKYIRLTGNTDNPNATAVTFDGVTGAGATNAQNWSIEDKIDHKIDSVQLGFVTVKANNTFVTPNSFIAPGTTEAKIQRGVDAAGATGFTENVQNGTYNDNVNINKSITILGQSRSGVLVHSVTTNGNIMTVASNGVTLNTMHLEGSPDVNGSSATRGVYFNSAVSNANVTNVEASLHQVGVLVDNAATVTGISVTNSSFGANGNGIAVSVSGKLSNLTVDHSAFNNNVYGLSSNADPAGSNNTAMDGVSITNSSFTGNTLKGMYFEKLSNATITNDTLTNNGRNLSSGAGLEVNLKYGTYSTIIINGNRLNTNGYPPGSGSALTVKARNDAPNYNSMPATLNGVVRITNNEITTAPVGISVGYNVIRTNLAIDSNLLTGTTRGIVSYAAPSGSTTNAHSNSIGASQNTIENGDASPILVNATCNWHGSNLASAVAAKISGNVTYIPYLNTGTDNAPTTVGFQPAATCAACTNTTATVTQTASTCAGNNDGALTVSGTSGGTGPYSYSISGPTVNTTGETSGTFTGLSQGTYTITVYQANGCSTALAPVTVKDQVAPIFTTCPAPQTAQPVNAVGCQRTVMVTTPSYSDNCTPPTLTYVLSGATSGSGSGPIGTRNFNVGRTDIVYTITDQSNNTATCSTYVEVVNTLRDSISGTATVVQNVNTTSNITFYGSGGTKPYTFYYNVNGGPTQSVSTTGNDNVVTVPQSNAVAGQYIYTLLSGTDAYGCAAALPADPRDTITVTTNDTRPDLISSVDRPLNTAFVNGQGKDGYVTISNVSSNPTTGTITFRISNMNNFSFNFPAGNMTPNGDFAVNNSNWTITPGPFFYTVTSNTGVTLAGGASSRIGFRLTATGNAGSQGVMTVTILNGTGGSNANSGDSNSTNNQSVKLFNIN